MGYPTIIDENVLFDIGLVKVPPGIMVVVEDIRGPRTRGTDIVKIVTQGADANFTQYPAEMARLQSVCERILGPEAERNASAMYGGTALERSDRLSKNGQGGRSYSTALTTEVQKGLTHPSGSLRVARGQEGMLDDVQTTLKEFNEGYVDICSKVANDRLHDSWLEAHADHGDVVNLPKVGSEYNNGLFTHTQINIAAPAKYGGNATLSADLKTAGSAHDDGADDPFSLSALTNMSDLGDMHPGHFHFVELGLYVELQYGSTVFFSGRHIHGATPPQPTDPDFQILPKHTRLILIAYFKLLASNRSVKGAYSVGPSYLPNSTHFEMDIAPLFDENHRLATRNPNLSFSREGRAVMPYVLLVTFIVREILNAVVGILKAMERSVPIRVDTESFLSSFYFRDEDGQWCRTPSWENAPGRSVFVEDLRAQKVASYQEWIYRCSLVIPKIVAGKDFEAYRRAPPPITEIEGGMDDPEEVDADPDAEQLQDDQQDNDVLQHQHDNDELQNQQDDDDNQQDKDNDTIDERGSDTGPSGVSTSGGFDWSLYSSGSEGDDDASSANRGLVLLKNVPNTESSPQPSLNDGTADAMDVDQQAVVQDNNVDVQAPQIPSVLFDWPAFDGESYKDASVRSKKRGFRYAPSLIQAQLPEIPETLHASVQNINKSSKTAFASVYKQTDSQPSPRLLINLRASLSDLSSTSTQADDALLMLSISRARIMLSHFFTWQHLQYTVSEELWMCYMHYTTNEPCACWVKPLINFMCNLYTGSTRKARIIYEAIFPGLTDGADSPFPTATVRTASSKDSSQCKVVEASLSVLAQWLGLQPVNASNKNSVANLWDVRGALLQVMVGMHLPGLFLMEETFDMFNKPVPYLFSRVAFVNGNVLPAVIYENLLFTRERADALNKVSQGVLKLAPDIYNAIMQDDNYHITIAQDSPAPPGAVVYVKVAGSFLRASRPSIQPYFNPDNPFETWMGHRPDQRIPIREYAPSRRIFNSDPGINPDFLKTRAGIFSLALFRGVTFSSTWLLRERRVVFNNLEEWVQAITDVPEEDLVDMRAYGTPNNGRSHTHALQYWEKSAMWEDFIAKHPSPSFQETLEQLTKIHFSQVGKLTTMLMAEDLYYGGVCDMPSERYFAKTVLELNKGACTAFNDYNVLPDGKDKNKVTEGNIEAFIKLYHALRDELEVTGDLDLLPDIFVFEHLDCKIGKAFGDVPMPNLA